MDHSDNTRRSALPDARFWLTPSLLLYLVIIYSLGLFALVQTPWWSLILGILAVSHSLILMAYLLHDCAHHSVFKQPRNNDGLGQVLNVVLGTAYIPYAEIRRKHMRHHIDKVDVIAFDYRQWMQQHPNTCDMTQKIEWLGIPATDLLFHFRPLQQLWAKDVQIAQRLSILAYGLTRVVFFSLLAWWSVAALMGYACAYLIMISVLRLMDLPQHSYQTLIQNHHLAVSTTIERHQRDRQYEQQNTYSNPLGSSRLLNFLVLNFGYHNAHHRSPTSAWFRLASSADAIRPLAWWAIIQHWWCYRCQRVEQETVTLDSGKTVNIGSYGLSFLTVA